MGSINNCFEVEQNLDNDVITQLPRDSSCFSCPLKPKKIEISHLKNRSNSEKKIRNINRPKHIDLLSPLELCDEITEILRIRVPFFNYQFLQSLSTISFLTGNGPYHEGLLIVTQFKNLYITQIYPITFIKVYSIKEALSGIMSFNTFNEKPKKYQIFDIYIPDQPITVMDIYFLVNEYPNKYNIFTDNCQKFCDNIIDNLKQKFKIKRENKTELIKFHYKKIKECFKTRKNIQKSYKISEFSYPTERNTEELVRYLDKRPNLNLFRKARSFDNKKSFKIK